MSVPFFKSAMYDLVDGLMDQYVKYLLVCQVEEAQRKHDLLVEIVRKDQDHNRRLVSLNT